MKPILTISDADTIRALAADDRIDRDFTGGPIPRRVLRALSYRGVPFPHMTTRNDAARQLRHDELWAAFNARSPVMADGPEELEALAQWIRGETDGQVGLLVQNVIGRFFKPDFRATAETWRAALTLREAANTKSPLRQLWWRLTGKVKRAKALLGAATGENLVAMHGIAVAAHNLDATMDSLRSFYANETVRKTLTPEMAVEKSLNAPPVVYRQALVDGAAAGCPYSKSTLFLLKLKDVRAKDMIFMSGTWSRCPAEPWIPAVIAGTWKRAIRPTTSRRP